MPAESWDPWAAASGLVVGEEISTDLFFLPFSISRVFEAFHSVLKSLDS